MDRGQELARLRMKKGLTQEALAQMVGTSGKYISELECGKPGKVEILARVAVALGVPLQEIYRRER